MKASKIVMGILAHVDSGKTTLAESMLYLSGAIRKPGRVDNKDAFLDNNELERARGITIFSKQAQIKIKNVEICLLDTPGHVDFSAEMERTLQVLDYAVLVISAADGVQGHTVTLWRLLEHYHIPVFIFFNKMDMEAADRNTLLGETRSKLDERCVDFGEADENVFFESVAMCSEELLESFLDNGGLSEEEIAEEIAERRVFPCFFGSALKQEGVWEFLDGVHTYLKEKDYPDDEFSARVFKITRDGQNNRLTHIKIMGGRLRTKDVLSGDEKVEQIRIYAGNRFTAVDEAGAGEICAVAGPVKTFSGEGLGALRGDNAPLLEPLMNYGIEMLSDCNVHDFYTKMAGLCEEYPELNVMWDERLGQIQIQVMGEVQLEILKNIIYERFGILVEFGAGKIIYKETIASPVVGIGHFEPLRHYAEVHLLLEPLEQGSGLEFAADCDEKILDKRWQRHILACLEGKRHPGVLTGSGITDMRITLIAGKAHQKHTEGGDFRQAALRAVRQGLKSAKNILLEPVCAFRLEVPQENLGRAIADIQKRNGSFENPVTENGTAILTGYAPAVLIQDYQLEVASYSKGIGRFSYSLCRYEACHNAEEVIQEIGYDSEDDRDNPTGSIFCAHGAGFYVGWEQVSAYAHIKDSASYITEEVDQTSQTDEKKTFEHGDMFISQEEVEEIFERTFGNSKKKRNNWGRKITSEEDKNYKGKENAAVFENETEYLFVDGYNIIFSWDELRGLAEKNIDSARDKLMDILCNYQGYKKMELVLVFDAYRVHGGKGETFDYHNIHIVYTKEDETADQYIEKRSHELGGKYRVTVATSDRLEQMIVLGQGARRISAQGFKEEVEAAEREIAKSINDVKKPGALAHFPIK